MIKKLVAFGAVIVFITFMSYRTYAGVYTPNTDSIITDVINTDTVQDEGYKEDFLNYYSDDHDYINEMIAEKVEQAINNQGRIFTDVISQETYGAYSLEWEYSKNGFNDLLTDVHSDSKQIHYEYDDSGLRVSKKVNGEVTYYEYDSEERLVSETGSNGYIRYVYRFDGELVGFIYDNLFYEYEFEENRITAVKYDGKEICRYVYDNDVLLYTYSCGDVIAGQCTDEVAIGEINRFRYNSEYVDAETGWAYSNKRYADFENERYIDGISETDIHLYMTDGDLSYELLSNIYEMNWREPFEAEHMRALFSAGVNTQEKARRINIIARVIYFESSADDLDQIGVAQVIQNRMHSRNMTAYEVVTEKDQFTALSRALTTESVEGRLWSQALENANRLYSDVALVYESRWFKDAEGFRSLCNSFKNTPNSFKEEDSVIKVNNGGSYVVIKNVYCPVPGYTSKYIISFRVLKDVVWQNYGQEYKYNVFFAYK